MSSVERFAEYRSTKAIDNSRYSLADIEMVVGGTARVVGLVVLLGKGRNEDGSPEVGTAVTAVGIGSPTGRLVIGTSNDVADVDDVVRFGAVFFGTAFFGFFFTAFFGAAVEAVALVAACADGNATVNPRAETLAVSNPAVKTAITRLVVNLGTNESVEGTGRK
jgi:hypothetical protein